jgi:hypothetical protein
MRILVLFGSGMTFLAHKGMELSGYQARVAFDASFDAAVRGQIESAKVQDYINSSLQAGSTGH